MENNQIPPPPPTQAEQSSPVKKIISLVIGLIVILLIVLLVVVVVVPRVFTKKNGEVRLTYWTVFEDASPFREIAAEFTKQNPNIKVDVEKQDIKTLGKYIERLNARISNGTGPDVFRYHASWVKEIKPLLSPLPQDVVSGVELSSKYYPLVEKDLKVSGVYYGIPIHYDALALFINTDLFQASGISSYPSTWDDLISAAKILTVKDDKGKIVTSGAALGTYDNIAHAPDIISLLLLQNGADLRDLAGPSKQSTSDALDFYTSFARGDSRVWDDTLENSKLAFARGKVAMYIGYSWDIFEIKAINPNLSFAVSQVPRIPQRNTTIASYWVEGVSSKTKYPKEAFEFLKFLASKSSLEKMYTAESKVRPFGELYPRSDMASLLKENALIAPFLEEAPDARSTIFSSDTYDDRMVDQLNKYLGDAVRSIVLNNSSPESAAETLGAGVAQKINQYEAK